MTAPPIGSSGCPLTCLAELRGAAAASGREDGDDALAEARAPLLDPRAEAPERRVRLAAVGVLHAVDLAAHAGALHHLAARRAHGPAGCHMFFLFCFFKKKQNISSKVRVRVRTGAR